MPPEHSSACEKTTAIDGESGITILEILVVLVILSLIAVVATIQVVQLMDRAKVDVATLQLRQISNSLELFRIDVRRYPTSDEGLSPLLDNAAGLEGWRGPYVKGSELLLDPWGQPIEYATDTAAGFQLTSLGADRKEGGEANASDIVVGGAG